MTLIEKYKQAPVTVKELKLNLFTPFEKQKEERIKEIIFENDRFSIEIDGYRLNQIHRDILDIAAYFGDTSLDKETKDKRPVRIFSLYTIQKYLNYKSKNNNKWINKKFKEISRSKISIKDKDDGSWIEFNIIDIAMWSAKLNKYAMVISELYLAFFENEISISYKHYLKDILSLKNAQSKALARFILSHSNSFRISLDKAMEKIGISNISKRSFARNREKILEDREGFKKLNITFKEGEDFSYRNKNYIIEYKKLPEIQIYHPLKNEDK